MCLQNHPIIKHIDLFPISPCFVMLVPTTVSSFATGRYRVYPPRKVSLRRMITLSYSASIQCFPLLTSPYIIVEVIIVEVFHSVENVWTSWGVKSHITFVTIDITL
jgi:hypothetical protein